MQKTHSHSPGTPSLYAVCGRDFSKIRKEGRIVPLSQMQGCPVICPDAKDFVDRQANFWIFCLHHSYFSL
jgi:hypothetical protein